MSCYRVVTANTLNYLTFGFMVQYLIAKDFAEGVFVERCGLVESLNE